MPGRTEYEAKARIAVSALFPHLRSDQIEAIVWIVVDFLMSLDAIATRD